MDFRLCILLALCCFKTVLLQESFEELDEDENAYYTDYPDYEETRETTISDTTTTKRPELEFPKDTVANSGTDVFFPCALNYGYYDVVVWSRQTPSDDIYIYRNGVGTLVSDPDKYHVYHHDNAFDLTIKNVTWEDGARYLCRIVGVIHHPADLIVLESPEIYTALLTFPLTDQVVTCRGIFGGPQMEYIKHQLPVVHATSNDGATTVVRQETIEGYPGSKFWTTMSENTWYVRDMDLDDTWNIYCEFIFEDQTYRYSSKTYNTHEVHGTFIDAPDIVRVGDTLTCHSSGQPRPYFEWHNLMPDAWPRTVYGNELIVTTTMLGMNFWGCYASNAPFGTVNTSNATLNFSALPSLQ